MTAPPNGPTPMDKIELIERSMRAFCFGLAGIVPFLGTPFAIAAALNHQQIKSRNGSQWNPAQRYLFWGMVCARIGITLTIVALISIAGTLLLQLLN